MHFGFTLDLPDIDLLSVDLLDQRYTHLDLFVSKTPWRRLEDMSSRRLQDISSRRLQDILGVTIFRLQDILKMSSRRFARCLQDIFARRLQDVSEDEKLLRWRHVEDVLKACLEDVFKTSGRPKNVCWVCFCIVNLTLGCLLFK